MTVTMDSAGRIVIPKEIRNRAGLLPGAPLTIEELDGRVQIEPEYVAPKLLFEDGLPVFKLPPDTITPTWTVDDDNRIRTEIMEERQRRILGLDQQG